MLIKANSSLRGIKFYYLKLFVPLTADEGDPCSGSECDHICALDKDLKPVCLCAVGYQLDSDMKKCTSKYDKGFNQRAAGTGGLGIIKGKRVGESE